MKKDSLNDTPKSFPKNHERQITRNAVCLCTDRRMLIPALFVANAVKSYSKGSDNNFDTIIFAEPSEVTDVHRSWMEQRGILLCEDMDMSRMQGICKFMERLSPATLMKLSLAEHLAGHYDKILYLDCDLTIHGDISSIFSLDTAPFALAAVPSGRIWTGLNKKVHDDFNDHCHKLGMTNPYRFFNTGVLYIDVERWNNEKLGERTLEFIRQNPILCSLPDEHALNAVLDGGIAQLSPVWNARPAPRWLKIRINSSPVIIHYAGNEKPWRRFVHGKKLFFPDRTAYYLYKDFLKDSPWQEWLGEQWGWHDLYMNIRGEVGRILRWLRLRGEWEELSAQQQQAYIKEVRKYYAEEKFEDVEQGIVNRKDGKLQLRNNKI